MSRKLLDGTVIPSVFRVTPKSTFTPNFDAQFKNFSLKSGYVIAAYPPNATANISKKHWEYDVSVTHVDSTTQSGAPAIYYNCRIMRLFGGIGDTFSYTLRAPESEVVEPEDIGSTVFILCDNGNSKSAYIVGSPEHPSQSGDVPSHHLLLNFNGSGLFIDSQGQVTIARTGPTDIDGTQEEPYNQTLTFSGNGTITLTNGTGGSVSLRESDTQITAANEVHIDAPSIALGNEDLAPVLRATDSYVDSAGNLKDSLKTFIGGVRELCTAIMADPMVTAPKAPAAALIPMIAQLEVALEQHNSTLTEGDAISKVTKSE